jgi:hypothetical protein
MEQFYEILSGICFALTGLWWMVVEGRKDWLDNRELRGLAGGVYASFLIPGVMSLGAQIGGDNKLIWRGVFIIAALLGMFFTLKLAASMNRMGKVGFFTQNRWIVFLLYIIVLVVGALPELFNWTGLKPIQIEAFVVSIIVLTGHGLAWEMMTNT